MTVKWMDMTEAAENFNITLHSVARKARLEQIPERTIDGKRQFYFQVLDVKPKKRIRSCQKKEVGPISVEQLDIFSATAVVDTPVEAVSETPRISISMREFFDAALADDKTAIEKFRISKIRDAAILVRDVCSDENYDRSQLMEACDSFVSFVNEI